MNYSHVLSLISDDLASVGCAVSVTFSRVLTDSRFINPYLYL